MELGKLLQEVEIGKANVLTLAEKVLADGTKQVELMAGQRALQPEAPDLKPLQRSPRRAHEFNEVAAFAAYVKANAGERCAVLADVNRRRVDAVLDEGKETGFETVSFSPQIHPLFQPWGSIIGAELDVLRFATFCMANRRSILKASAGKEWMDGRELALVLSQIHATSKTTLARGQGSKCINGVMVETEIKGQRRAELVELPDTIVIRAPMFLDTVPVDVELDLLVVAKGEDVVASVSAPLLADALTTAMLSFVDQLREALDGCIVGLGRVAFQNWEVIG